MTLLLSDFQEKKKDRLASTVGIPLKSEGVVEVNLNFFLKCVSSLVRFSQLVLLLNMANTENGSMSIILDPSFVLDMQQAIVRLPLSLCQGPHISIRQAQCGLLYIEEEPVPIPHIEEPM